MYSNLARRRPVFDISSAFLVVFIASLGLTLVLFALGAGGIRLPGQTPYLAAEDFELTGTVGRLSTGIRAGGTGEMVYSKAGTRRVASARSEDGRSLERGDEVVIVRSERGVAYVQTFEEFMKE